MNQNKRKSCSIPKIGTLNWTRGQNWPKSPQILKVKIVSQPLKHSFSNAKQLRILSLIQQPTNQFDIHKWM